MKREFKCDNCEFRINKKCSTVIFATEFFTHYIPNCGTICLKNRIDDINNIIKETGLKKWKIADEIGVSDSYFSQLLGHKASVEKLQQILEAIYNLLERDDEDE